MSWLSLGLPTAILIAGLINDLKTKKVKNGLVMVCAIMSLMNAFYLGGMPGVLNGLLAAVVTVGLFLPFVALRILGAGDMKLMIAFALGTNMNWALWTTLYSFLWAILFGIVVVVLKGQFKNLFSNIITMVSTQSKPTTQLHQIPYTVALLLGWLTHASLIGRAL